MDGIILYRPWNLVYQTTVTIYFPRGRVKLGLVLAILAVGLASRAAQLSNAYPDQDERWRTSLNGTWNLKYVAGSSAEGDAQFYRPDFDARGWKKTPVPSHWELEGFAPPKYKHVDSGLGLYRHTFRVPSGWEGRRVFLRFEGVQYGFDARVNGQSIGSWASSYNPSTFDITDVVKPGAKNLLAVQVTTRSKGFDFDENDCWALSGIYRNVELFSTAQTYLEDYTFQSTLKSDGSAVLRVQAVAGGAQAQGATTVTVRLWSPAGNRVLDRAITLSSSQGVVQGEELFPLEHPILWTAETPNLYRLQLGLQAGGNLVQQIEEKVGIRQVTIEKGVLKLNGTPVKLRGVDHHDIWPKSGRTATEALLRGDLQLMRSGNINFLRTSHYPPDRRLIEYCDEMGIYVMCEVPFGFGDEHLTDPSYQESLLTRARATIRRDKNRPSVIVWSVGNENKITPIQLETGREVKRLDATRPICFPTVGTYFATNYQQFPEFVDIYATHYPVVSKLREYAETLTRPVILTEYAHELGLASDRVQDEWEIMYHSPRLAGGAVWMFQDQGILRATNKPVDRALPTKYVWTDPLHYYDTFGTDGMDGIVYSDRTPQVDYWQVRKVYSPVQISERIQSVNPGPQEITLQVENRFDFRPLRGMSLAWTLRENRDPFKTGKEPLAAAAHERQPVTIRLDLPSELRGNVYSLELQVLNESGESIHERVVRLQPENTPQPAAQLLASLNSKTPLRVEEAGNVTRVVHENFQVSLARDTGEVKILDRDGKMIASGPYPHIGRKFTAAEEIRTRTTALWKQNFLQNPEVSAAEVRQDESSVRILVRGKYTRPDAPEQWLSGEQTLLISTNGDIEVNYTYEPAGAKGALLEAGISFLLPATDSEFRWLGQGPFAGFPGKDRLNEFGLYQLTRDDIRFQGNRREVEIALLTDRSGLGLALVGDKIDVAVENTTQGIVLSQNMLVSGRGNKGGGPETPIVAEKLTKLSGKFHLLVLGKRWPAPLVTWFGKPSTKAKLEQPFYYSYDQ